MRVCMRVYVRVWVCDACTLCVCVQCILHGVHFTQCTMYSVHCTVYIVHLVMYTVHCRVVVQSEYIEIHTDMYTVYSADLAIYSDKV